MYVCMYLLFFFYIIWTNKKYSYLFSFIPHDYRQVIISYDYMKYITNYTVI